MSSKRSLLSCFNLGNRATCSWGKKNYSIDYLFQLLKEQQNSIESLVVICNLPKKNRMSNRTSRSFHQKLNHEEASDLKNTAVLSYLAKMMYDEIQGVFLHISSLHSIGGFQDLYDIFKGNVHLKILFAKCLKTVICEAIKNGSSEKIQRILRWHGYVSVINIPEKRRE